MTMTTFAQRIAQLDTWLDSMRGDDGYGGPVVHWWKNSLHYTGVGLDWRYEGIVHGYLNLYAKTQNNHWLQKAQRATDDIVRGQLEGGNFRFSSFEQNPHTGGTPHEAACDIALLAVAKVLQQQGHDATPYITAARKNIENYYIGALWNADAQHFQDNPSGTNIVPNKAATLCEALFLLAELTGEEHYIKQYAIPTLQAVLTHQITDRDDLNGAIYQLSTNGEFYPWLFPYYAARCVPALLLGYEHTQDEAFLRGAKLAIDFVQRYAMPDGGYSQILYLKGPINHYPKWVAGVGDILRVFRLLAPYDYAVDLSTQEQWLLNQQHINGSFPTGYGFGEQVRQQTPTGNLPNLRDILPVVGWTDKAFRYLTELYDGTDSIEAPASLPSLSIPSQLRGRRVEYFEDAQHMTIKQGAKTLYHWNKGDRWADIRSSVLLWK